MTEFCKKLSQKGFSKITSDNNTTVFSGDFTGRDATVAVGASDDGKSVYTVVVFFDSSGEWNVLTNTSITIKTYIPVNMGKRVFVKKKILLTPTLMFL